MSKTVKVTYNADTLETTIVVDGKEFDTSRINGKEIADWAYPFMVRKVRWDGFYDEMVTAPGGEKAFDMLYMDRVTGRITPERYDILAAGYEKEQSNLKSKLAELDSQLDDMNLREKCVSDFISKAKQYIDMPKLTPELFRTFIRRIEVYEKTEKYTRTCGNHIIIYFTFQADKAIRIDGAMAELDTTDLAE